MVAIMGVSYAQGSTGARRSRRSPCPSERKASAGEPPAPQRLTTTRCLPAAVKGISLTARNSKRTAEPCHQQVLGRQVQPLVTVTCGADQHDLSRAVGLEHRGAEHLSDQVPLEWVEFLRADDDGLRRKGLESPFIERAGEHVQRVGI